MLSRFLPLAIKACTATFVLTAAFAVLPSANAQILSQFTFGTANNATSTGVGYSPTTTGANVVASDLTLTSGTVATMLINTFTYSSPALIFNPSPGTTTVATTAALAVAGNRAFDFTITPNSGFTASFSSLTFDVARGGATTPRGYVVRSSRDGFAANIATADVPTVRNVFSAVSIDLTGGAFQDLTTATTFRVYSYGPVNGSTVDYDNVTVNGTTASVVVPEASSMALFALASGLGAMLIVRRKK